VKLTREQAYSKGMIALKLQPSVLSRWAKSSGDIATSPHIDNIEEFGTELRSWYMSMLPEIRVGRKNWLPLKKIPADPLEWDGLRKGSRSGFVLLLVALSWWIGQATRKKDKDMAQAVLRDVLFVVRELLANASDSDKCVLCKWA
jgi:hypothetical protein